MHGSTDIQPQGFPYYGFEVRERVDIVEVQVTIGRSLGQFRTKLVLS